MQLDQGELDALVLRELLSPGNALIGVRNGFINAELRSAERRGRLTDTVFVHEVLGEVEAMVDAAE